MKPESKDQQVNKLLLKQNLRRMRYASFVGIMIALGHILYFSYIHSEPGTENYTWHVYLIRSHVFFLVICVIQGLFLLFTHNYAKIPAGINWLVVYVTQFGLLIGGVAVTVIDQLVISHITPFILLSFAIALIYLLQPYKSVVLFSIAFLLLFFTLPITQDDPEVLLSLRTNALSITLVSIMLSIILWRTNTSNFRQSLIIDEQKQELEQANNELEANALMLSESNKTKDRFFTIIAHDLKSPFNSVMGFADLLADQLRENKFEGMEQYVNRIQQSSHLAMDLLDNLMDWARSQTGRIDYNPKLLMLPPLVDDSVSFFANHAHQKAITVATDISDSHRVFADEKMLRSILHNLISNAIKFTRTGGNILIKSEARNGAIRVSVIDNGIGININMLKDLFSIDKTTNRPGTEGEPSTGLGLGICKEFTEKHSGKIWAESTEGKGTAIHVSLPAKPTDQKIW